jgi:hypothetical protein
VLSHGAVVDLRTRAKLGGNALGEVLAALWPGDCQSCGASLGFANPALAVDDLPGVLTRATLHHRTCRTPQWNDSWTVQTSSSALLTWRTVVLLLPFQAGRRVIRAAGLLVNPGLEEIWLSEDVSGWHPHLEPSFAAAGLTRPADGIPIRNPPAADVTGHLGQASLTAGITGRIERYTCDAQPEILAAAAQHGGFVLIATHAADPDQLTPAGLMHAFASPMTLVGWVPL